MNKRTFIVATSCDDSIIMTRETIDNTDINNPENFGINNVDILLKVKAAGNSKMTVKRFLEDYGFRESDDLENKSKETIEKMTNNVLDELFNNGFRGFNYIEI